MLSERAANLGESTTLALNAKVKALKASGQRVYNLTAGEPDMATPEYIQKAVAGKLAENKYTPSAGLVELRAAIAKNARDFYGVSWIEAENVIVTGGAKPALSATFQVLLNPGDEVIAPSPSWLSYKYIIELAGGKMVSVSLKDDYDLDAEAVARAVTPKTKAILINSPHNPTGAVFSAAELQKLADEVADKPVMIIADDLYVKLTYDKTYQPITTYFKDPAKLVIINGFSKSQALTGWRIGYLLAPLEIAAAADKLLSHVNGTAPTLSQLAALSALAHGDKPPMLEDFVRRRQLVIDRLKKIPGLKFEEPGGAFYVFIDVRDITDDSQAWCEQLLDKTGVALVPGDGFNAPGFVRLSFAAHDDDLEAALKKLAEFVGAEA